MMEEDAGRNFKDLDAREAQEALAEELSDKESEATAVHEETEEIEAEAPEADAPEVEEAEASEAEAAETGEAETKEAAAPEVEWSEEDLAEHKRMVEALLFAAAEPLDEKSITDRLPAGAAVSLLIEQVAADYEGRGITLKKVEKKWRFVTAPDIAHVLQKEKATQRKLSRAALETLAIIAYHQPCTRADIEDVRGVQVAKGSLDQLLEIGWVKMRGKRKDVPGRPTLYGTTEGFLEHFGLETVTDLPGLADLKAAGLLDARLPPGFSVPSPVDGDDEDMDETEESGEFSQDFLGEDGDEAADA
ncbi:SMC-Scp complex subunit ScpB [Hyphococcus sp.]|uniref:SMC-Scp complex subunit ScpB n=1 Tax=Hyphococcus sp. TaxID=2038636 RepID=UPI0035C73FD5